MTLEVRDGTRARSRRAVLAALVLPIALVSCDHQLVWTFKLDAIDESVVRSVRAVISRGPCAGPPGACAQPELASIAYQDDFPADAAGTSVPTLDPGEYCFYGIARNPACAIVAVGCEPVQLPIENGAEIVEVSLHPFEGELQTCPEGRVCAEGLCVQP